MTGGDKKRRICLGAFAGAHGVKGEAKLKSFTEIPEDVAAYGVVESEDGALTFSIRVIRVLKGDMLLVSAPEIKTREAAAALAGTRLYVGRGALPEAGDDEFYMDDLVGLAAFDEAGAEIGAVAGVYNFGAGDILELKNVPGRKGTVMIAFTKENVADVDLDAGRITIADDAFFEDSAEENASDENGLRD